jgi:hypothetical protein
MVVLSIFFSEQESTDRHVASHAHNFLIPSQPIFDLAPNNAAYLAEQQQIHIL